MEARTFLASYSYKYIQLIERSLCMFKRNEILGIAIDGGGGKSRLL